MNLRSLHDNLLIRIRATWPLVLATSIFCLLSVHCSQNSTPTAAREESKAQSPVVHAAESATAMKVSTPVLASNETFIKVAKEAMASVVNISATKRTTIQGQQNPFLDDPFFRRFFGDEFEKRFQQPRERQEQGLGSGVIVSEDGYVVTCGHSDQLPGERLTVRLSDGRDADAVALGTNPVTDIGLVKITTPGSWPFAEIAESSTLKPGEPLVVAGYPATDVITKKEWSTERTPQIDATAVRHPLYLLWYDEISTNPTRLQGGMSGGGVFNQQ